jgi:hypothetical protein
VFVVHKKLRYGLLALPWYYGIRVGSDRCKR